jgi:hypothetical protein
MGFAGGSMTFKRFFVSGQGPQRVDEPLLEQLAARAIGAGSVRTSDKTEIGWTTGDHILDTRFDFTKNAVADGLHAAVRIDTHKPPADLVRSYQRLSEQAMLEASGREFLSRAERREAREQALSRADAEARSGNFRRMSAVPVFWDLTRNEVYLGSAGSTVVERFTLLFRETFDLALVAASAGEIAGRWAARSGETRLFDDCTPAPLVSPPDGAETAAEGGFHGEASARDFLGTEWLVWLWYVTQAESPEITTGLGQSVTVLFEKTLQLECAFKLSGRLGISAEGPTQLPEALVALAGGKRPVRAGLQLALHGDVFGLALRGDGMNFSGVQVPVPEDVSSPRAVFEDRIEKLRELLDAVGDLYGVFLKRRLSSRWPQTLTAIRGWIASNRPTVGHTGEHLPAEVSIAS